MTQATAQITPADTTLYQTALNQVVRYDERARGRVRLTGQDRASLLQRLTTNDIVKLKPGEGARTVLINHNARILDVLTVYALPEHLLITTNPGSGPALSRFLQSKIFFNDKVAVQDLTSATIQINLYGPQAAKRIEQIVSVDASSWPVHHIQAASIGASQVWIARTLPIGGDGFAILAQHEDESVIQQSLADVPPLDAATFEVLRIEQGYGGHQHEYSTEYIPLETGLTDAVSFTKGCYVGQEIIARMESRNRLAKRLMGLRLAQPVAAGGKLQFNGKEAGDLTSTAISPRFGSIGLAYVRSVAAVPGTIVQVGDGIDAEVVELPFQG